MRATLRFGVFMAFLRVTTSLKTTSVITFISSNEMKIKEVKALLGDKTTFPYQLECKNFELLEPQATPVEISRAKCAQAAQFVDGPVIVEDTSLHFNGMNGMPGPFVKFFYESMGNVGLAKMLDSFEDRSAYAQCVVSFTYGVGQEIKTFVGVAEGTIIKNPTEGMSKGFGWDPIFIPSGFDRPFGQMELEQKNQLSHRFKAFRELKGFLNSRTDG